MSFSTRPQRCCIVYLFLVSTWEVSGLVYRAFGPLLCSCIFGSRDHCRPPSLCLETRVPAHLFLYNSYNPGLKQSPILVIPNATGGRSIVLDASRPSYFVGPAPLPPLPLVRTTRTCRICAFFFPGEFADLGVSQML